MRIVVAHLLNNYTGSPKVLAHGMQAWQQAGHSVDLYTSAGPGFLDQAPTTRRYQTWYQWHPHRYRRLLYYVLSQVLLFCRLLRYWREPVIMYVNTLLPIGAAIAGRLMGKRVIYHVHETAFQPPLFSRLLSWIMRITADQLIFVSHYLQAYHQVAHLPQSVIHNALDPAFVARAHKAALRRDQHGFEVLMLCSLKKAKGIFAFIELARQLPNLRFTLVISQSQAKIERFLGKTPLPNNLQVWPAQSDVHAFYAHADLLLNLSHPLEWPETFGMSILEGLSYGLPVIVPPAGAPLEFIQNGAEGFHLDVRELPAIRQQIQVLADDPALCARMGTLARQKAAGFEMKRFTREMVEVILS